MFQEKFDTVAFMTKMSFKNLICGFSVASQKLLSHF